MAFLQMEFLPYLDFDFSGLPFRRRDDILDDKVTDGGGRKRQTAARLTCNKNQQSLFINRKRDIRRKGDEYMDICLLAISSLQGKRFFPVES